MNDKIAQIFDEIGDMLEILGENVFRIRAYRRGAEAVRNFPDDVSQLSDKDIESVSGIGKDLKLKIKEITETEKCKMHKILVGRLSPGILDVLRVRGIGPKKVKMFYNELNIDSIEKLRAAAENGSLASLPGMGGKSQDSILAALDQNTFMNTRHDYKIALKEAKAYIKYMKKCDALDKIEYAGSLRRKKATIGDVDLLVTGSNPKALSEHFLAYKQVKQVLAAGETKSSVVIEKNNMQIDFRVVDADSFGAALFYFTGPKHFNIDIRRIALHRGMKVNEYGIFKGEAKLAGELEEEMFEALDLEYIEPENREDF